MAIEVSVDMEGNNNILDKFELFGYIAVNRFEFRDGKVIIS